MGTLKLFHCYTESVLQTCERSSGFLQFSPWQCPKGRVQEVDKDAKGRPVFWEVRTFKTLRKDFYWRRLEWWEKRAGWGDCVVCVCVFFFGCFGRRTLYVESLGNLHLILAGVLRGAKKHLYYKRFFFRRGT